MGDQNGGFEGEIDLPGGSFSRLLLSPDDGDNRTAVVYSSPSHSHSHSHSQSKPPLFSSNTPKMLCFGDFGSETTHSTLTYSDDSSVSSSANTSNSHKRRNGSGQESGQRVGPATVVQTQSQSDQKNGKKKKNKPEVGPTSTTTSYGHAKARREKLGERINVLQLLVCPYGKTDTASVLHEAMGYIRFLHDQVKVLCSPYLHRLPSSSPPHHLSNGSKERDSEKGLRSRGLCLVPVQCVVDVAKNNGSDFWSSATTTPSKP